MIKNRKTIWLVCANVQPPSCDTHLRHQKFADYLNNKGYNVIIFAASYLHYNNKNLITNNDKYIKKEYEGKQYVFIKVPSYVSNGLKRMFSIFQFGYGIYCNRKNFTRPDLIVHNLQVPFDIFVFFTALKLKVKYITEVWDLWPESFVAFGLLKRNNLFLKIAYKIEEYLYRKADRMIFTMEGAKDYILDQKWDTGQGGKIDLSKYVYINNGVDLKDFDKNKECCTFEDYDLEDKSTFKVIYLGSIRFANNVKMLIDAAKIIQNEYKIKFLIYGDGDERESLLQYCEHFNIVNVVFKQKWIDIKYVPYVLSCSSLNILNYKKNDIVRYGGSQGKLFQYMASGKPICSNQVMGYDLIKQYKIGIAENFESASDYANAIKMIYNLDPLDYNCMCESARVVASEYDYGLLAGKFYSVIKDVLG